MSEEKYSARLPVVAWRIRNGKYWKFCYAENHSKNGWEPLCRLTDAQARLAEKDARIAQIAAHARGKNKALANALAEVERLREANLRLDEEWQAMRHDLSVAQEQLEQLQAAPAERVMIAEVAELYCPEAYGFEGPETFPDCGTCVVCRAKSIMATGLNPAPATAEHAWQPIETAPKNERILIARAGHPWAFVAKWCEKYGHWSYGPSAMDYFAVPTHWMRHREPPATADSDVREVKK